MEKKAAKRYKGSRGGVQYVSTYNAAAAELLECILRHRGLHHVAPHHSDDDVELVEIGGSEGSRRSTKHDPSLGGGSLEWVKKKTENGGAVS